jgi:UDP-N-acetylmuramate--alanine ligase
VIDDPAPIVLSRPQRLHVVGIGGTGMAPIAMVLLAMGHEVSGSDHIDSVNLTRLRALGARVIVGHDASSIDGVDAVIASSAVAASNIELVEARRQGVPVLWRAEALAAICATRRTLAVAGTKGKTTTAAMLAAILTEAGWKPSFIIGGDLHGLGHGAMWRSDGEWLVVEADESDGTFLVLASEGVIVTNVLPDHLDFYGGLSQLHDAFATVVRAVPGPRVLCADDPGAAALVRVGGAGGPPDLPGPSGGAPHPAPVGGAPHPAPFGGAPAIVTFGAAAGSTVRMTNLGPHRRGVGFDVTVGGSYAGRVELAVPGAHNARNACGALALALALGVDFDVAGRALGTFREVARRFQWRGERDGITYVDDYAHLPSALEAVLATARAGGWDRVVAVFQPHRYSRTESLHADFADAFVDADVVVLTDVYGAGEPPRAGITGQLIVDAVTGAHPAADVRYVPDRADLAGYLRALLGPGDICLTLGAGNLNTLPDELLASGWR